MESIPAHHRSPTAAEHLKAHSFSTCGGGSSIHIKAEVTHGAGECTNEALSVMVGESSSCWCNLFQNMLLLVWNHLLYLIVFGFHVVLFCFYLNDNLYFFHSVITIFIHLKSVSSSSAQNFPLFPKNKLGFVSLWNCVSKNFWLNTWTYFTFLTFLNVISLLNKCLHYNTNNPSLKYFLLFPTI